MPALAVDEGYTHFLETEIHPAYSSGRRNLTLDVVHRFTSTPAIFYARNVRVQVILQSLHAGHSPSTQGKAICTSVPGENEGWRNFDISGDPLEGRKTNSSCRFCPGSRTATCCFCCCWWRFFPASRAAEFETASLAEPIFVVVSVFLPSRVARLRLGGFASCPRTPRSWGCLWSFWGSSLPPLPPLQRL